MTNDEWQRMPERRAQNDESRMLEGIVDFVGDLQVRTRAFALNICLLLRSIPVSPPDWDLTRQLARAATSVGANYRAAVRARSSADMIAKLKIVEEECDECLYWLELLIDLDVITVQQGEPLLDEGTQLLKMTVSSINTLRKKAR